MEVRAKAGGGGNAHMVSKDLGSRSGPSPQAMEDTIVRTGLKGELALFFDVVCT
ncbi:hypothetical protein DSLASN_09180 [Desulfoluna limicola]|uniref:Uncharacterized protein n=1 Tax=Desulfoluna limicola TaxID=2810562 RepID=A0ABM7PDL8_9BACT|nr:hypothetical protein DSLASN_09180 [Desulfoluna limicola]